MYAGHAPPGLVLPVTAKLLHDLVRALHGDPDHRPHHVREGDARHVELDRGRVRPPGELPVKLGTQVERDPHRLGADRGLAGRPGVGFGAPGRGGGHLRLAPLQLCGHDGTFPRGTHRSMRSWATPRHTSRPISGIGTPKLWAYTSRLGTAVRSTS